MALTPADVHNVAFSKPRIGKRGYCEEEVDLFLDLVEEELVGHIERNAELCSLNAELRNRVAGLDKREAELADRQAELAQRYAAVTQRERQVGEQEARLCQQEAAIARREARLREQETEIRERQDRPEPVRPFCVNGDAAMYHLTQSHQPAPQSTAPHLQHAVAHGPLHSETGRTVSAVHGRHHMERTAIRAVTDILGNRMTETVCEWMRTSTVNHASSELPSEAVPPLQELMRENAELTRSNGILKAAAALLAAELDRH
ncbi:DivIVA domain-containing protein [Mycobacterium haemophilum]